MQGFDLISNLSKEQTQLLVLAGINALIDTVGGDLSLDPNTIQDLSDTIATSLDPSLNFLTDQQLRSARVEVSDTIQDTSHVEDYPSSEIERVETVSLSGTIHFLMVDVDNADGEDFSVKRVRVLVDSGESPSQSLGFVCRSGSTTYLPFPASQSIKVFIPAGVIVSLQMASRAAINSP